MHQFGNRLVHRSFRSRVAICVLIGMAAVVAGCKSKEITGPDPLNPAFFKLQRVDNLSLPYVMFRGDIDAEPQWIDSATLIPYAIGHPGDQRLVNDRTGGGGTGGNTRDTTVARGQMMDLRFYRARETRWRDSSVVDVEKRDTMYIITRPHPDPTRVQVDTGYVIDGQLVLTTFYMPISRHWWRYITLNYQVSR